MPAPFIIRLTGMRKAARLKTQNKDKALSDRCLSAIHEWPNHLVGGDQFA